MAVMAGIEGVSGTATDEFCSNRLQWLRQRREALQDKLAQKNNELKNLCIEEAELTGVLPPEIPLEPGESPPTFRKRVGASFNYPSNLINKLRICGSEESALELEKQAQINIAERALTVLNDPNESKAIRRKHRSIYQQSQRRIQELNLQLNFIRQSLGSVPRHTQSAYTSLHSSQTHLQPILKHRTKKPRPPLDTSGTDLSPKLESQGFLQEGGISLSPLGSEHNYTSYPPYDLASQIYPQSGTNNLAINQNRKNYYSPSPLDNRSNNVKFIEHDVNVNMYVIPEHFRNRTYSQGGNSTKSISPHHVSDRVHLSVPNTYTEEEWQLHYRQMKLKKQESEEIVLRNHQYPDQKYLDNDTHKRSTQMSYHETDHNAPHYEDQLQDFSDYYSHGKPHQPKILQQRGTVDNVIIRSEHKASEPTVDAYVPPGYWMRLNDEIVWCSNEDHMIERFGSLDRRKQNVTHHSLSTEIQSRYYTVAIGSKNATAQSKAYQMQIHSSGTNDPPMNNRILLRTQSLGSVENWQSAPGCSHDGFSAEGRETTDGTIYGNKPKEKEWYETSLDSSGSTINLQQQQHRTVRRASQHNPIMGLPSKDRAPVRSNSIPSNRRVKEQYQQQKPSLLPQQKLEEQQRMRPSIPQDGFLENRVLEIPAESNYSLGSQENGNEPIVALNLSTTHTVVQAGKYQPYREVTKPFEMSDFYKYSTKFRKRVEENEQQQMPVNTHTQNDQNQPNNSIQRINQPMQQNTSPTYVLR